MMRLASPLAILLLLSSAANGQCVTESFEVPLGDVALDGQWAAIGDVTANDFEGQVVVSKHVGGAWVPVQILSSPKPQFEEFFGSAVSICDEWLAIGAHGASPTEFREGRVYVYRLDAVTGQWGLNALLEAADAGFNTTLGYSVDIDPDRIIAGGPVATIGSNQQGAAYVFRRDADGQWVEEGKLFDPNGAAQDHFGFRVAISGDLAITGAHGNDDLQNNAGAAFVYEYEAGVWELKKQLHSGAPGSGWFGYGVDTGGGRLIVGAPQEASQNGAAYIFEKAQGEWVQSARLAAQNPAGPFPILGTAVALSDDGNVALAGASNDNEVATEGGAVHVFTDTSAGWIELAKIVPVDAMPGEQVGALLTMADGRAMTVGGSRAHYIIGLDGTDCNGNGQADACDIHYGASLDHNDNGIPDECEAGGDLNGDGVVNVLDLLLLITRWGVCAPQPPGCTADLNFDGTVNVLDLLVMLSNWG